MDLGLRDKAVLVTGATRGIDRALALADAGEGTRVGITCANDEEAAAAVVQEIEAEGGSGMARRMDLAEPASIDSAVTETAEEFGAVGPLTAGHTRCAPTSTGRPPPRGRLCRS